MRTQIDKYELQRQRREMVERQIVARGIKSESVLSAMEAVPREEFIPFEIREHAFDDRALSVGLGQTISQPYIVAYMTEVLDVRPQHRVLEVGTGTGYQTAVLARLAGEVFTIERLEEMYASAECRLAELHITNVRFRIGDGSHGWPEMAPFDRIMVTAAGPCISPSLVHQLADGGRMVVPVGPDHDQRLTCVQRQGRNIVQTPLIPVRFVRLVGDEGFATEQC